MIAYVVQARDVQVGDYVLETAPGVVPYPEPLDHIFHPGELRLRNVWHVVFGDHYQNDGIWLNEQAEDVGTYGWDRSDISCRPTDMIVVFR